MDALPSLETIRGAGLVAQQNQQLVVPICLVRFGLFTRITSYYH
jgi:hypothetical protein